MEKAGLKEGLALVAARNERRAANLKKSSRWSSGNQPIPCASPIAALNQARQRGLERMATKEQSKAPVVGVDFVGFVHGVVQAAVGGAGPAAGGLSVANVRKVLAANKKGTDGDTKEVRARLKSLLEGSG